MISAQIHGLAIDQDQQQYVVLLNGKGEDSDKWLPLGLNPMEAQNIAFQLGENRPERPISHDLMAEIASKLDANVTCSSLRRSGPNSLEAVVTLSPGDHSEEIELEATPADAIALALRTDAKLIVDESIMESGEFSLPANGLLSREALEEFGQELQEAVKQERYEKAAQIRDQIRDEMRRKKESMDLPDDIEDELRNAYEGADSSEAESGQ